VKSTISVSEYPLPNSSLFTRVFQTQIMPHSKYITITLMCFLLLQETVYLDYFVTHTFTSTELSLFQLEDMT
jgi:hypothetical protein